MITKDRTLSTTELAEMVGITIRQLDYWATGGVIPKEFYCWVTGDGKPTKQHGSGNRRRWSLEVVEPLIAVRKVQDFFIAACGTLGAKMEFLAKVFQAEQYGDRHVAGDQATILWSEP